MAKDLERLLRSLESRDIVEETACWRPSADVVRTQAGWLIKIELAGVRPEDVVVRLKSDHVTICGQRRDVRLQDGECIQSMEISYSQFQRTIALPACFLARATLETRYEHGMLFVFVRRAEEATPEQETS